MKKILLMALLFGLVCNVEAKKDYASFKKSSKIENDNKEVFQNGRALQISSKENSVVILSIERTVMEGGPGSPCIPEFTSLVSVVISENSEVVFNPEDIDFVVSDGCWEYSCEVADPVKTKILAERKANKKKKWAQFSNAFNNSTAAALNTMNINNDYSAQMNRIQASAEEFLQITTLNNDTPEASGKVVFAPLKFDMYDKDELREMKEDAKDELELLKEENKKQLKELNTNENLTKSEKRKQLKVCKEQFEKKSIHLEQIIAGAPKYLTQIKTVKATIKIGNDIHSFYFDANIERF